MLEKLNQQIFKVKLLCCNEILKMFEFIHLLFSLEIETLQS